jgi:hypothetical protein
VSNLKPLGKIGALTVQLDITDPDHPALIVNDNAQGENLVQLLSDEPLLVDWLDGSTDHIVLRLAYTPDVDKFIVDLVDLLVTTRYAIPHLVQLSLLDMDAFGP